MVDHGWYGYGKSFAALRFRGLASLLRPADREPYRGVSVARSRLDWTPQDTRVSYVSQRFTGICFGCGSLPVRVANLKVYGDPLLKL